MHKINLQNEIDQQLKKLSLQFVALSQSAGTDSAEKMQEFIAGIRTLYEQALSLQHFSAIQALTELDIKVKVNSEEIISPAKVFSVQVDSLMPTSQSSHQQIVESPKATVSINVPAEEHVEPVVDPLKEEIMSTTAKHEDELRQVQESFRRKKVITDIHDKFDEVPTLAGKFNGKETHASRMAGVKMQTGLAEKHQRKAIPDLKQAIGTNEKFLFINQLFRGDAQVYTATINFLNNSGSLQEAKNYINQNLQSKYDWDPSGHPANLLLDLVERRFLA